MLDGLLHLVFTHLGQERQDLCRPCDEMCANTDWASVSTRVQTQTGPRYLLVCKHRLGLGIYSCANTDWASVSTRVQTQTGPRYLLPSIGVKG